MCKNRCWGRNVQKEIEMQTPDQKKLADKYGGLTCTLDGRPARISGRLNKFATVGTLDGKDQVVFSWQAVQHVMEEKGKAFKK